LPPPAAPEGCSSPKRCGPRYLPQFNVLEQIIARGDLGSIRLATADVGWRIDPSTHTRLRDPAQAGGAILDMGVYGYWFAHFAIGAPSHVRALGGMTTTGVDEQTVAVLSSSPSRHACVSTSFAVTNTGHASIVGTEGHAAFLEPFVFPASFVVRAGGGEHRWTDDSGLEGRKGLAWQATAIAEYIRDLRTESPLHSLDDSIAIMDTMDEVIKQISGP
jgi:predicted dehydrogenase